MMTLGKSKMHAKFEVASLRHCRNIKGDPKILWSSLDQGHAHFSSGWDFMMDLGKPHPRDNFEVVSLSHCRNIKGEPQFFGSFASSRPRPLFALCAIV